MNRLLGSELFRNSRRYPALFRFIVEETLEGRGEFLKERLLGVRVFDRPADYDTAADPVVRVTVAEIRKRIAQYYHEEDHDGELRIELLPGRYVPEFRPSREETSSREEMESPPESSSLLANAEVVDEAVATILQPEAEPVGQTQARSWLYFVVFAVILPAAVALSLVWRWGHPNATEEFWGPILASRTPVVICLPIRGQYKPVPIGADGRRSEVLSKLAEPEGTRTQTYLDHLALDENVVFSDVLATIRISDLLAAHDRVIRPRLNVLTTLDDLRQGPAILIGGLDNPWTMRSLAPLRFHFLGSDEDSYWIADAKHPENRSWSLKMVARYDEVTRDFAIVARVHNEVTGQVEIIVAGIGMTGTAAAGEFLVDPHKLEELRRTIGPAMKDHDFEAVLGTEVVNGTAGASKILATAVW